MTRRNVVIAGDFNSDLLTPTGNGIKLQRILHSFNFRNIIKVPTRTSEHSNTLLDLILTNNISKVQNFKNVMENPKYFKHDLESAPWWVCSTFDDINDITWAWDCMYNDIVKSNVTPHKAKVRKCSLPWMNGEIRKEMNKRYKLLKACDGTSSTQNTWADYKTARKT